MDRDEASTWDRLAPRYGAQERLEERAIATALRLAAPAPGERLIDLASGTGLLLRRLAARDARPSEAVGIDRSAGMLARVGPLPAGWSVLRADARAVPLPDRCAGVVTCAYLLHLLDATDRRAVLGEARRLLRPAPDGRLVVVTVWSDERRAPGRLVGRALRSAARMRPGAWGGLRPLDPTAELAAAGFDVTRRVVLPRGGYPSLVLAARPSR
jgi:ubiquinone/menaquinone biosynthesis C-methylase UbiE